MKNLKIAKKGQIDLYSVFLSSRFFETIEDYINLELSSPRFLGNLEKYFYNPITLTKNIKHLFPKLQTLYRYSLNDERFEDDKKIYKIKNDLQCCLLSYDEQLKIEEVLNGKRMERILFDSKKDNWSINTSIFHEKILNKENVIIIIESETNIKFGGYISSKINVISEISSKLISDINSFLFTFKNRNFTTFEIKHFYKDCAFELFSQKDFILFKFGNDITLLKKDFKESNIQQNKNCSIYDYKNMDDALIGTTGFGCFIPKRFLVVQMDNINRISSVNTVKQQPSYCLIN